MWWRYIDDIFAIWPHGEEHLTTFLGGINNFHPSIKFTAEWSYTSVTFLNTKVTVVTIDVWSLTCTLNQQTLVSISTGAAATLAIASVAFLIARPLGCVESAAGQKIT